MPLLVTDYSWTQTETMVHVNVPLKGAKVGKVDIISSDEYLKVHYPPFLFEVFLFEPIDNDRSTAKVGNGVAILSLSKRTNQMWEQLMMTSCDKETKKQIRQQALLKHQEKLLSESQSKAEKKRAEDTYLIETMMKLEREEAKKIRKMKDAECERTTAELEAWQPSCNKTEEDENKAKNNVKSSGSRNVELNQRGSTAAKCKKQQVHPPALRRPGNIQVTFTPRVFSTPLRESKVQEEEEWLRKQAEARRILTADAEELKELKDEERNPDWLKDKGDKCFMKGDYLSALNAYSLAIRLNRKMSAVFSNRAACHLKLGNLDKAIEDSSQALDLLTPHVAANAEARARAHVRRGAAFCELQLYVEGLWDYEAALKIYPDDESLQSDAQKIRGIIQGAAAAAPDKQ
ncbi:dynein assembly factor 4, axonemal [Solea senegalensis]|uniref:Dynein axonemal assembly factor 4 n=1 Tax=Solea senegalensis TaxID=28829 RepID=A0AAV6RH41_SOLSE|nr:dynein axonemal assembly factor 4-like [Solea senegalensis]KAG7504535.1 dynein assembly factor 4, axonemal [Solea senegalensis]